MTKSIFTGLFACVFLASCASLIAENGGTRILGCDSEYLNGAYPQEKENAAESAALYAMLANNAYDPHGRIHFHLPPDEWTLAPFTFADPEQTGLQLSIYEHRRGGQIQEVVIAFRGTDEKIDWLHGNIFDGQYELADKLVPRIVKQFPSVPIVAVGHSLGGGLALHTSLMFDGIRAFAFNPSPRLHSEGQHKINERTIITENDDPLNKLRMLWIRKAPDTKDFEYHFATTQHHSIYTLARGLLLLGSLRNQDLKSLLNQNCDLKTSEEKR